MLGEGDLPLLHLLLHLLLRVLSLLLCRHHHRRPHRRLRCCSPRKLAPSHVLPQVPVSERYAVVVQPPVTYNIKSMVLGQVRQLVHREPGGAAKNGQDERCLPPHPPHCACLAPPCQQAGDYIVFDWKPEHDSLLHVVPLLGGEVGRDAPGVSGAPWLLSSTGFTPASRCASAQHPTAGRPPDLAPRGCSFMAVPPFPWHAGQGLPRPRLPGHPLGECLRVPRWALPAPGRGGSRQPCHHGPLEPRHRCGAGRAREGGKLRGVGSEPACACTATAFPQHKR